MSKSRFNRAEKKLERNTRLEEALHGEGVILYRNHTKSDINLPKPANNGQKWIGPGKEFQGDTYFRQLVGKGGLSEVRIIIDPNAKANSERMIMEEEKLMLDQPDRVTVAGTVETIIQKPKVQKINETTPQKNLKQESLIVEDPMGGVEILN